MLGNINNFRRKLYLIWQERNTTAPDYYRNFKTIFQSWITTEDALGMVNAW